MPKYGSFLENVINCVFAVKWDIKLPTWIVANSVIKIWMTHALLWAV